MDTLLLDNCPNTQDLIRKAHEDCLPVAVSDGVDECLIAMTPAVFERILFDTAVLNTGDRTTLRF